MFGSALQWKSKPLFIIYYKLYLLQISLFYNYLHFNKFQLINYLQEYIDFISVPFIFAIRLYSLNIKFPI